MKPAVFPLPPPGMKPEEIHAWFVANGIAITEWCRSKGFSRYVVHDLLRGKRIGRRGESHLAAIALGIKAEPTTVQPRTRKRAA